MSNFSSSQIGISTNIFNNPKNILKTIETLSKDFSVIEIELDNGAKEVLQEDEKSYIATVKSIRDFCKEHELYISVHAPYIGPDCDISSSDESVRRTSCKLLRKAIKFCGDIGGERLTYHPGYLSSSSLSPMIDILKCSLNEIVPFAREHNVKLCLENSGDERPTFLVFSPEDHIEISKITGTRLTVDLVHHGSIFAENGEIGELFFEKLAAMMPYVENIHIADMVAPKHVHLPIGEGNFPVFEILSFLSKCNYQGNVIVEEIGGGHRPLKFVDSARKFRDQYREQSSRIPIPA
jgi:sugar phosphate isomerase/epimerase